MLGEERRGERFFEICRSWSDMGVYPDDRELFRKSMERETLLEVLDRSGAFIMTYRIIRDAEPTYVTMKVTRMDDDERFIIIGITNVDEEMKQRKANERMREQHIAYSRINALTGDFICIYVVVPETGRYREYSSTEGYERFALPVEGEDFFGTSRKNGVEFVYPEDRELYLSAFTSEEVLSEIERSGIFALTYRLLIEGKPRYVQLRAAMVEEQGGLRLIVGINDIDSHVRQEEEYARRLAQAQSKANIDALTGVKNRHAYLDAEDLLDREIAERRDPEFAIIILDLNDLKRINDTEGHKAGDKYIKDACKIICSTFKHSPVYRVGGDEFAVIAQNEDYQGLNELIGKLSDHNDKALQSGGVVIACGMSKYEKDACVAQVFERADLNMYENKSELKSRKKQ